MGKVADRRGMERTSCMVSSPTEPLGSWLWVYGENTGKLRHCQVVDVSAPKDRARHLRLRRLVEIAGELEQALCGHRNEPVVKCPVVVYDAD
jgi:hypothetical protein